MKMEKLLVSFFILLTAVSMSFFSAPTVYRIFPLIFGIGSLIGYVLKKTFIFDTSIFFMVISFLFANGGILPTFYNLFVILAFFFLLIGIWLYARNTFLLSGIEEIVGKKSDIGLSKFRRSLLSEISNSLLMAALLSILASLLVLFSSLGIDLGSLVEILLMLGLSTFVFFITFLIIKMLSSQEIRIGKES